MRVSKLKLNPEKTKVLSIGALSSLGNGYIPTLVGVALTLGTSVCNWGVFLGLLFAVQVWAEPRGAYFRLGGGWGVVNSCDHSWTRKILPWWLIHAQLLQCVPNVGLPWKSQLVQNAAAHMLLKKQTFHHATLLLQELHWKPVVFHVQFKLPFIIYKALYGLGLGYLKDHFPIQISAWALWSSDKGLLQIPPMKEARLVGIRKGAFSGGCPALAFPPQGGSFSLLSTASSVTFKSRTFKMGKCWLGLLNCLFYAVHDVL